MESIVGKILCDRYRIIRELSHDDFSTLYLAEDTKAKSIPKCQIERLQPSYDSEVLGVQSWRKTLQEFDNWGKVLKNISQHPQIPQLLAFFECDREFYLVRESIPGESLEQQLERGNISENQAFDWLQEILGVLEFVHQANIIHLNIQPASLIQARDGKKYLTNFAGIKNSILFGEQSSKTVANHSFSTVEKDEDPLNFTQDIYALGKTIIYALTGSVTGFVQSQSATTVNTSLTVPDNLIITNIKPELADLLNKMVESNPTKRYQSASEILAELNFEPQNLVSFPPPLILSPHDRPTVKKKPKSTPKKKNTSSKNFSKIVIWILLTLPFIAALTIVFIGLNKNAYAEFAEYNNSSYKFNLKYPQDWLQKDIDDPITGEVVSFTSPRENNIDLFSEKLYIAVEYLPSENTNLEEYSQSVIERIKQKKDSNIEIYQEGKTKIANLPARMIVYSRQQQGINLKQMEVFTIKNDRVYVAIYTAERAKYSKFLEVVEKIINSWEIE